MPLLTPLIVFFLPKQITLKCRKCYVWHLQFLQGYLSNFFNCNENRNTHKWPCNPIPRCVLSAKHCHRQQSQTPAGTELNSCLVCLVLFIASWPRKLKVCLGEGVAHDAFVTSVTHSGLVCGVTDIATVFLSVFGTMRHLWVVVFVAWEQSCIVVIYSVPLFLICCCFATDTCKRGAATRGPEQQAYEV